MSALVSLAKEKNLTKFVLYECAQVTVPAARTSCAHINDDSSHVFCFSKKSCEELFDWLEANIAFEHCMYL